MNNDQFYDNSSHVPVWLSQLIREEVHADSTGIINVPNEQTELELLDTSSIELMEILKNELEFLINTFNQERAVNHPEKAIKFFKIANTVNDFMIYRKSLKMIFTRRAVDLITIQINRGQLNSIDLNQTVPENNYWELNAKVGRFNQVEWFHFDEKFQVQYLVPYLLTIFIRSSMA
jgi:hypothetical protein